MVVTPRLDERAALAVPAGTEILQVVDDSSYAVEISIPEKSMVRGWPSSPLGAKRVDWKSMRCSLRQIRTHVRPPFRVGRGSFRAIPDPAGFTPAARVGPCREPWPRGCAT